MGVRTSVYAWLREFGRTNVASEQTELKRDEKTITENIPNLSVPLDPGEFVRRHCRTGTGLGRRCRYAG